MFKRMGVLATLPTHPPSVLATLLCGIQIKVHIPPTVQMRLSNLPHE